MRVDVVAVLALLVAPLALAQADDVVVWTQAGGDAARSREVTLRAGPLDVIGISAAPLASATQLIAAAADPVALEIPGGLVALARPSSITPDRVCTLLRIAREPPTAQVVREEPCGVGSRLLGVHPSARLVLVGFAGAAGEARLVALDDVTLAERWRVGLPEDATHAPATDDRNPWRVRALVEADRVVAAFSSEVQNEVLALDLDGGVLWRSRISPNVVFPSFGLPPPQDPTGSFSIREIVAAEGGYFAWGVYGAASQTAAVAWMDRDGRVLAGYVEGRAFYDDVRTEAPDPTPGDAAPTAQGETAMMVMGQYFVAARVSDRTAAARLAPIDPQGGPLVWWREHLTYRSSDGLTVVRAPSLGEAWSWKPPKTILNEILVTRNGHLLVVSSTPTTTDFDATLSWVDLATQRETRRLPLPSFGLAGPVLGDLYDPQLVPLTGGDLLLMLSTGEFAILGRADEADVPHADVSDAFPPTGRPITLDATAPQDAQLRVDWGDGTFETHSGQALAHTYAAEGRHLLSVTALYPDGRTATREIPLEVGGTPPQTLSAIQRAFSRENQELTFFLLGLTLTGCGALLATLLRQRRHARLAEEERVLRHVIEGSLLSPTSGLAALETHRARLRDAHMRRRLDDAQFGLLDHRTVRAMKAARYRLLGSALNKLSPHFRRLLDTALEDGQVTSGEMAALVASLDDEAALTPLERERVRKLLSAWAR